MGLMSQKSIQEQIHVYSVSSTHLAICRLAIDPDQIVDVERVCPPVLFTLVQYGHRLRPEWSMSEVLV